MTAPATLPQAAPTPREMPAADAERTPLDAMLDLAESAIRTVVDQGGETALRARIERLLPPPAPPREPAGSPEGSRFAQEKLSPLDLATVVSVCVRLSRHRLAGDEHAAIARLREIANAEIRRMNDARGTAPSGRLRGAESEGASKETTT